MPLDFGQYFEDKPVTVPGEPHIVIPQNRDELKDWICALTPEQHRFMERMCAEWLSSHKLQMMAIDPGIANGLFLEWLLRQYYDTIGRRGHTDYEYELVDGALQRAARQLVLGPGSYIPNCPAYKAHTCDGCNSESARPVGPLDEDRCAQLIKQALISEIAEERAIDLQVETEIERSHGLLD